LFIQGILEESGLFLDWAPRGPKEAAAKRTAIDAVVVKIRNSLEDDIKAPSNLCGK
jgi:hypothetical protein